MEKRGWRLNMDPAGRNTSLRSGSTELIDPRLADDRPKVTGLGVLDYEVELIKIENGVPLKQIIRVKPRGGTRGAVKVEVPRCSRLPFENRRVFLPVKNGIGRYLF